MKNEVIAWRNGIRKVFTAKQWDILGTDKYGWVAEPETPKEVVGMQSAGGNVEELTTEQFNTLLSVIEKNALVPNAPAKQIRKKRK